MLIVLKCRFDYNSGMARPTHEEITVIEKTVYYTHRSQEEGTHHAVGGAHREVPGLVRRQRKQGENLAII